MQAGPCVGHAALVDGDRPSAAIAYADSGLDGQQRRVAVVRRIERQRTDQRWPAEDVARQVAADLTGGRILHQIVAAEEKCPWQSGPATSPGCQPATSLAQDKRTLFDRPPPLLPPSDVMLPVMVELRTKVMSSTYKTTVVAGSAQIRFRRGRCCCR